MATGRSLANGMIEVIAGDASKRVKKEFIDPTREQWHRRWSGWNNTAGRASEIPGISEALRAVDRGRRFQSALQERREADRSQGSHPLLSALDDMDGQEFTPKLNHEHLDEGLRKLHRMKSLIDEMSGHGRGHGASTSPTSRHSYVGDAIDQRFQGGTLPGS